jgi:Protein of unknown function (DUF4199)
MDFSFFKTTYKYGIYLGLGLCLYTVFMWLTKLDMAHYHIGQYLDFAVILLPVFLIFIAIKQETKAYKVSIVQRLGIAVFIGLIGYLIYDPFLYIYHHFINPDWYNGVLNLAEKTMQAAGKSATEIAENLTTMKEQNAKTTGLFELGGAVASALVMPLVIGLLSLIFVKNKAKTV